MNRREAAFALAVLGATPFFATAQHPVKSARIGYLSSGSSKGDDAFLSDLTAGLEPLGWKVARNLTIEARYAELRLADLPRLAGELIQIKPDVIVCNGPATALAFKRLSVEIPVVFVAVADPISLGLAKTLGRPGGNFTGLATLAPEFILAKQIEILRETVPRASRISFLTNPGNPVHVQGRELRLRVAKDQGLKVVEVEATKLEELATAFAEAARQKADVMYLSGDPLPLANAGLVAELATKHRLPVMFLFQQHVDAGGLMSYGTDLRELYRRAAFHVDKVLKGASPRDLPIEEPTTYLLVINLRAAKALGIKVPQSVLLRADRVIE